MLQLLAEGLDARSLDDERNTLMHYAVSAEDLTLVQALIDYPFSVNAMTLAVDRDQLELVRLLLTHGANPSGVNRRPQATSRYKSAISLSCCCAQSVRVLSPLVR